MQPKGQWRPATATEDALLRAVAEDDRERYFRVLAGANLLVLVRPAGDGRAGAPDWLTRGDDGRMSLVAFTSRAAMAVHGSTQPHLILDLAQLAGQWPDPDWGLMVDPGLPIAGRLPGWLVARLGSGAPPDLTAVPAPAAVTGPDFRPANLTEQALVEAVREDDSLQFVKIVVGATVLVAVEPATPPDAAPGDHDFAWRVETYGEPCVLVFTSAEALAARLGPGAAAIRAPMADVLHNWPRGTVSLAVNAGSPIAVRLPADRVAMLAARVFDLTDLCVVPSPATAAPPVLLQKVLAHNQVPLYLDDGHGRVGGLFHAVDDVAALGIAELAALPGFAPLDWITDPEDGSIHVVRFPAFCPQLYRPVAEAEPPALVGFGILLPHRAQLLRIWPDGYESLVGEYDARERCWQPERGPAADPYRGDLRDGYVAGWDGTDYLAWPSADGVHLGAPVTPGADQDRPAHPVKLDELDALRYRRTTGLWRGERFVVIGAHGDWLRLELDADEPGLGAELGLEEFDHRVFQAWAARADVEVAEELVGEACSFFD
ncbi:SseB family protein [Dactylosporangium sp. AC04546]|uniref:SseB family protein n=1 Tax=Dactylosporangium sp. AC04546 TaxID=2862460 RepID=UPI001EDD756C|nr:SseB family protein [Dactylosporangium sp. AC04546]WVK89064.1 SseB family protein [Dactylosporangium sp. AC04546]